MLNVIRIIVCCVVCRGEDLRARMYQLLSFHSSSHVPVSLLLLCRRENYLSSPFPSKSTTLHYTVLLLLMMNDDDE